MSGLIDAVVVAKEVAGDSDYGLSVRAAVRGFWRGDLDFFMFVDTMNVTINRGFTRAWHEGIARCGLLPGDMTLEEIGRLNTEINSEISHILGFATSIEQGSKANNGKLAGHIKRAEMWSARYSAIRDLASSIGCPDLKMMWVMNPLKEHCSDCLNLDGRVYRSSVWRKYGIYPRMHALACRGFKCGCRFQPTTSPVTPGFPPAIGGI